MFMHFSKPLLQLPIRFAADRLAREVAALPSSAWVPHPQGFAGNDAVPLVSVGGGLNDDIEGPMAATEHLRRCPYVMGVMGRLNGVWGRSRLMGLAPGSRVPSHVDIHYYWRTHIRIHIPVVTNPDVRFACGDDSVHMAPGECWVFDSFRLHEVRNEGSDKRIHLVLDTVGGDEIWDLIEAANGAGPIPDHPWLPADDAAPDLAFERINQPKVMTAWEMRCHVDYLADHVVANPRTAPVMARVDRFIAGWQAAWTRFGEADEGRDAYRRLIAAARDDLAAMGANEVLLDNDAPLPNALDALIFRKALARPQRAADAAEIAEPLISQ